MLAIAVVFVVLWVLGLAASITLGGLIHLLLLAAMVLMIFEVARSRKAQEWVMISPRYRGQSTRGFMLRSKILR